MKCYFLRHGLAVEPDEWSGSDFDRPLTDEGQARMARAAKTMSVLGLGIDVIVTSPLVRAKQTATIVAKELKLQDRLVEDERMGVGFGPGPLAAVLADHHKADAIMLVGHEPSMSRTVGQLVGGASIELKKGSLACVDVPDPSILQGELIWLIPAKFLAPKGKG
jgi:phosphohistidine phosphatase